MLHWAEQTLKSWSPLSRNWVLYHHLLANSFWINVKKTREDGSFCMTTMQFKNSTCRIDGSSAVHSWFGTHYFFYFFTPRKGSKKCFRGVSIGVEKVLQKLVSAHLKVYWSSLTIFWRIIKQFPRIKYCFFYCWTRTIYLWSGTTNTFFSKILIKFKHYFLLLLTPSSLNQRITNERMLNIVIFLAI